MSVLKLILSRNEQKSLSLKGSDQLHVTPGCSDFFIYLTVS